MDAKGGYTQRSDEAASIRKILESNEKEFMEYEPEQPNAVILYDRINHDFVKAYTEYYKSYLSSSICTDSIAGLYKCLWEQNIPVKFVTPDDIKNKSIDKYNVLFVTNQVNMSDELGDGLKYYLSQGGTIICDGKFGEIHNNGLLHEDVPGCGLWDDLGFSLLDMHPDNLSFSLKWNDTKLDCNGYYERREIELADDEVRVIASYSDGTPAIIEKKYGKGRILYISTFLWYGYFKENSAGTKEFMSLLDKEYGLSIYSVSNNEIKVRSLKGENGRILFAFNYGDEKADADISLKCENDSEYYAEDLYSKECGSIKINKERAQLHIVV